MAKTITAPRTNTEDFNQFLDWYINKIRGIHYLSPDRMDHIQEKFTVFKS